MTRFKQLREDKDIKQETIAKLLKITQATYNNIENNKFEADYQKLIKLALFYNTSIDYLLGITNQKLPYPHANLDIKKIRLHAKALFCAINLTQEKERQS